MLDTRVIRELFPYLKDVVRLQVPNPSAEGRLFVDNTASTHLPMPVLERFAGSLFHYANVHRGEYDASLRSTQEFERAYNTAANLVNAHSWREIILGRNTTEMINLVMRGTEYHFRDGDNIVVTGLEHNSNYVPWHMLQQHLAQVSKRIEVRIAGFDHATGKIKMSQLREMVDDRTKIVACTGASNFMGVKPDLEQISSIAHSTRYRQPEGSRGAYFVVDGAQLVPGSFVDVQQIDCDFLAWSFHKMALPLGVGGLYGREKILDGLDPFIAGGDMILDVKPGAVQYNKLPWKFTAGTPNILGITATGYGISFMINLGLGNLSIQDDVERIGSAEMTSILMNTPRGDFEHKYCVPEALQPIFKQYGSRHPQALASVRDLHSRMGRTQETVRTAMENIQEHERELTQRAIDGLTKIPRVVIYGPKDAHERVGLVTFNIEGIDPKNVASLLNREGVEVRNGTHCASLAHHYLGLENGSVRMSFYVYNTPDEVDTSVEAVRKLCTE